MPLSNDQQDILDGIVEAIHRGEKRIKLIGSAGTGKTFLVAELVKVLLTHKQIKYGKVISVLAPTNKALSILLKKIQIKGPILFKTVHSALKMNRYINPKTGAVSFVSNAPKNFKKARDNNEPDFTDSYVCIVDECSMLNTQLLDYLDKYHFTIIFVGDDKQLNPVGEPVSPIWTKKFLEFELTQIIRQGAGNPIIDLSRDLEMVHFKIPKLVEEKGYIYNNNLSSIINNLAEVNGTDEMKYLSWTNADVDAVNKAVREKIYGTPKKIEPEETLVFNTPYGSYYTNQEIKVESLAIITSDISPPKYDTKYNKDGPGFLMGTVEKIKLRYYRVNDSFDVIHEDSDEVFKSLCNSIKHNCKNYAWNWKSFYFFVEQFADIKYNHAISVHKSQGSTYKETILNIGNLMFNKDAQERDRLLYTGITRASDLVVLHNVR